MLDKVKEGLKKVLDVLGKPVVEHDGHKLDVLHVILLALVIIL